MTTCQKSNGPLSFPYSGCSLLINTFFNTSFVLVLVLPFKDPCGHQCPRDS